MAICCVSLILRRCGVPQMYASLLRISGALHLALFEQPGKDGFFQQSIRLDQMLILPEFKIQNMNPTMKRG